MLLCAAGSIFNDLCRCMFLFCLLFFMEVVELSAADTGLIILIGQIVDSLTSVISGYLGDMVKVPVLSQKIGMRKSWHLMATVFMGIVVPLCVNRCILCSGSHQTWLPTVYYGFLYSLYNMCFSVVEINHLAFITTSAVSVEELTDLSAIRFAMFIVLYWVTLNCSPILFTHFCCASCATSTFWRHLWSITKRKHFKMK